jgi:beta-lactamase regulating signal transducer with metallopeptidase domain
VDDLLSIAVSNAVATTILALAVSVISAVYRRPALVHGLWLLVLLKLVTPPLVLLPGVWGCVSALRESPPPDIDILGALTQPCSPDTLTQPCSPDTLTQPCSPDTLTQPCSPDTLLWPQTLRIVWGVGALTWFLLALKRLHHFRRLLRFAQPAPAALQERTLRLAQTLELKRCPGVRLVPGHVPPLLWAFGGLPCLLVPVELLDVLSEEQLDTLLVHELAHLRRRDHWVRVLEFVVMGLYWWHPVVWYARRELREAEEQCCDAWVVSTLPGAGRTYASALLDTLDFLSTTQAAVPPLASGLGQIADLKRRLTMIMQGNTPRSLTWPGCLAIVALGLMCLPMLPSLHGEPPGKKQPQEQLEEAEKALEKAKAALEHQKAELAQKAKGYATAQQQVKSVVVFKAKGGYHIDITLPADESVDPNDIVAKIRKALPENLRDKVVLRPISEMGELVYVIPTAPPGISAILSVPPPPGQPGLPNPAVPPSNANVPLSKSSEKRINELEKKLKEMLRELHELQKQLKESRPGPSAMPPHSLRKHPSSDDPYYAPNVPLTPNDSPRGRE